MDETIVRMYETYFWVNEAFNLAKSGDIILLSPSCSSHDVYKNFIERGEHFKEVVHTLKK